jgi:hypothetical protein
MRWYQTLLLIGLIIMSGWYSYQMGVDHGKAVCPAVSPK